MAFHISFVFTDPSPSVSGGPFLTKCVNLMSLCFQWVRTILSKLLSGRNYGANLNHGIDLGVDIINNFVNVWLCCFYSALSFCGPEKLTESQKSRDNKSCRRYMPKQRYSSKVRCGKKKPCPVI